MAKQKPNKEKEDKDRKGFWWFFKQKKNLPLLLSLLGGSATVITGTLLLSSPANPSTSNGDSSPITSSSQVTSVPGSEAPFSGNEVPDWNLDNPTINPNNAGFGVAYDQLQFNRYQDQYLYQSGKNFYEGAPSQDNKFLEPAFTIYNVRQSELVYSFQFDSGENYKNYIETSSASYYDFSDIRIAYDLGDTIYTFNRVYLQLYANPESQRGGNYQPMIDLLLEEDVDFVGREVYFLLKFDVNDASTYTIIDFSSSDFRNFYISDILIVDDIFYVGVNINTFTFVFPEDFANLQTYSFIPFPENPTLSLRDASTNYGFIYQFDYSNPLDLQFINVTTVSTNYNSSIFFLGYRVGFETRYTNENGELYIRISATFTVDSDNTVESYMSTFEETFIPINEKVSIYDAITLSIIENVANIQDRFDTSPNVVTIFNFQGFYNFDSNHLSFISLTSYASAYEDIENVRFYTTSQTYETLTFTVSGDIFKIINKIVLNYPSMSPNYIGFNPNYLVYAFNELCQINPETKAETILATHDNDGVTIVNIFERQGGYYLIGNYYENEAQPNVQSVDAYIQKLDVNFNLVDELIIAGSGDEVARAIVLDNNGQPVFIITSNSIDGPFAPFADDNENQSNVTYIVSF